MKLLVESKEIIMQKRNDIQILRALAVIFVVLFHLEVAGIESGFLGVDVFFVVSGFLMATLYKTGQTKKFLARRAKRLLPAYFTTVALTLIASLFIVLPSELTQVATQSIYSIFFANNIGFWMQNSYFSKTDFNPLLHLWSLGVEIQFYLIVPLLAWLFRKSKVFLHLILIGSLISCIYIVGISPKTSFFMMPLRIWEFLIGFIIAYYLTDNGKIKTKKYEWIGAMGLIIICAIPFINVNGQSLNRFDSHPSLYALLICFATSLVLSFGLPRVIQEGRFGKLLAKIGDYSYSIYLVHFPIIVIYLYQPFSGTNLYPENYIDKIIIICLIIVASILMHIYVETSRINNLSKTYAISLVSILILIGATKVTPNIIYDQNKNNIFAGLTDRATYRCGKLTRIKNPGAITCKINAEEYDQSVLLVGNSHADSIKKAFAEVASTKKFNTYFMVSNAPLISESVTVDQLVNEAVKLNIQKIILHYSGQSLNINTLNQLLQLSDQKNIIVDLIMPVPVYEESIPKLLYFNLAESMNSQEYLSQYKNYFSKINELKNHYKKFTTHYVHNALCQPDCAIKSIEYKPYYFDSNHLTLTGAQKLKPVFESIF